MKNKAEAENFNFFGNDKRKIYRNQDLQLKRF